MVKQSRFKKFYTKKIKRVKHNFKHNKIRYTSVFLVASILIVLFYTVSMQNKEKPLTVNEASLQPLLSVIAEAESGRNYNAYFGNSTNTSLKLTTMSLSDVLKWQSVFVAQGSPSSAAGRYQILNTTLAGLIRQLDLNTEQLYDEKMQDELAITLLIRRGANDYINNVISAEQFAAQLAREWAALPKTLGDNPNNSYYAGDGLNRAQVSIEQLLQAIQAVQPKK